MHLNLELTPHDLSWDIDGTGPGDGVDPKLRPKGYNLNMDPELGPDLDLELTMSYLIGGSFCIA